LVKTGEKEVLSLALLTELSQFREKRKPKPGNMQMEITFLLERSLFWHQSSCMEFSKGILIPTTLSLLQSLLSCSFLSLEGFGVPCYLLLDWCVDSIKGT
jgi:hypothetical protein